MPDLTQLPERIQAIYRGTARLPNGRPMPPDRRAYYLRAFGLTTPDHAETVPLRARSPIPAEDIFLLGDCVKDYYHPRMAAKNKPGVSQASAEARKQVCLTCEHYVDRCCALNRDSEGKRLDNLVAHTRRMAGIDSDWSCEFWPAAEGYVPSPRQGGCNKRRPARKRPRAATESAVAKHRPSSLRYDHGYLPEFITTAQLVEDSKKLAAMLPADVSQVIGIARGGFVPAAIVANILHLPMLVARQEDGGVLDGGHGFRLKRRKSFNGPVVVIDDNCLTGATMRAVMPKILRKYPGAISAAVCCNRKARTKPDLIVRSLDFPVLLEWNLFNSAMSTSLAMEMEGVLCENRPDDSDYEAWLPNAKIAYPARRFPVRMVLTSRHERYRQQTADWLTRHGIDVQELIMAPDGVDIAEWKAEHVARFAKFDLPRKPPIYIESDPHLAAQIAQRSGQLICCPAAGRVFGRGDWATEATQGIYPAVENRNLIYHLYPTRGNDGWRKNIDLLRPHDELFNGKRAIAVVTDASTATLDDVREYLGWDRVEWLTFPNDHRLGEVASFPHLLKTVASTEPNDATFYGHGKGVTSESHKRKNPQAIRRWRNMMYRKLLDESAECMAALEGYAAVGVNKRLNIDRFPGGLEHGAWHFSGAFFWFRNDILFSNPACMEVPRDRYGVEAWLGGLIAREDSLSRYQRWQEGERIVTHDMKWYGEEFD